MADHPVTTEAAIYDRRKYLNLNRVIVDWHQANEVARCCPEYGTVLEIGPGPGHVTWLLKKWRYHVSTADIDPSTKPDMCSDVRRLPLAEGAFDCVLAAEVLEHLPFAEFGRAMAEIRRVTRRYAVLTLPCPLVGLSAVVKLPRLDHWSVYVGLPYWRRHPTGGGAPLGAWQEGLPEGTHQAGNRRERL